MVDSAVYLEIIVEAIHQGLYNERMLQWDNTTDRAIFFHMYEKKADIKSTANYFGLEENFIKERIKDIVSNFNKQNEASNDESFSQSGR